MCVFTHTHTYMHTWAYKHTHVQECACMYSHILSFDVNLLNELPKVYNNESPQMII